MDITIQAALVTGLLGIVGVFLHHWLGRRSGFQRVYLPQNQVRLNAIQGLWEGKGRDVDVPDTKKRSYTYKVKFSRSFGKIRGDLEVWSKNIGYHGHFALIGGFYDSTFLKFEYNHKNKNIQQFGIFFLKLSPDARSLNGKFVGFGTSRQDIVEGFVKWEKIQGDEISS